MYLRQILTICILLCLTASYAQKKTNDPPDNDNLRTYLRDGRIKNVMNMIRFRFSAPYTGYLGLSYERRIHKKFGIEVGGYYKVINQLVWNENARLSVSLNPNNNSFRIEGTKGGFGITAYPKLYLTGKSMNNGYFIGVRTAAYSYSARVDGTSQTPDQFVPGRSLSALLMLGSHQQWGSRFAFGVEWGLGVTNESYKGIESEEWDSVNFTVLRSKKDIKVTNIIVGFDMILGFLF